MGITEMIERLEESMQSIKDICMDTGMDSASMFKIKEDLENIQTVIWALKENTELHQNEYEADNKCEEILNRRARDILTGYGSTIVREFSVNAADLELLN